MLSLWLDRGGSGEGQTGIRPDTPGLEGAFLDGDGSGVEKLLADHFCVVGLEQLDNPLADAFVGGILRVMCTTPNQRFDF